MSLFTMETTSRVASLGSDTCPSSRRLLGLPSALSIIGSEHVLRCSYSFMIVWGSDGPHSSRIASLAR